MRVVDNPMRSRWATFAPPRPEVRDFHRRMPAYAPTLLVNAPSIAARGGVAEVLVKAETRRMGLPSFKILGASWATYRAVIERLGHSPEPWANVNELARKLAPLKPFALTTATDGNHGRAVAHMARLVGFDARVFVPAGTSAARVAAIRSEGAEVFEVDGDYDAAVARAAEEAGERCLIISDTSWPGYETVPGYVIEGYATIFAEIDQAIAAAGREPPTVVIVPVGVGALMAAAVRHLAAADPAPRLIGVEPVGADCALASVQAGHPVTTPGPHPSIMVGLNCGTLSMIAWPELSMGVDTYVSLDDEWARQAMKALADAGVVAGETGAATTGALLALSGQLDPSDRVLVLCTEGATDPDAYRQIVGRAPETVGTIMMTASR